MGKKEEYQAILQTTRDWIPYLKANSALPGPRGNLELAYAAAKAASSDRVEEMLAADGPNVLENSPEVFVVFCGIVSWGALFTPDDQRIFGVLKRYANDPRWRIREAAAMSLQEIGKKDMRILLHELQTWLDGSYCELRAVIAGLCEPVLLKDDQAAAVVLDILDRITTRYQIGPVSDKDGYEILKKGLNYCWSVAVTANPDYGKKLMEKWMASGNPVIRKIMLENLKKNRLSRMDPDWVNSSLLTLQ